MPNLVSPDDLAPGYLFNTEYYELDFENAPTTAGIHLAGGTEIKVARNEEHIFLRLDQGVDPLSVVRLKKIELLGDEYYKVDKSHSLVKGQGHVRPLYQYAFIHLDLPVVCDSNQTKPGSSNLWKKLHSKQSESDYQIFVLDTISETIHPYTTEDFTDYDIWGWDQNSIDLYNVNPGIIDDEGLFDTTALSFDTEELGELGDEEITFDNPDDFPDLPHVDPILHKFLRKGKNQIKDLEHIRLFAKKKEDAGKAKKVIDPAEKRTGKGKKRKKGKKK